MLYLENRLRSLECIVHYLDKHKTLELVKQKSTEYAQVSFEDQMLVYVYPIHIDLAELFDMNVDLGNQIFFTPMEATSLFQEVIYQYINDLQILPCGIMPSQICIKLRIESLPTTIDQFHIHERSDLTLYSGYQGFIKLTGITTGISGHMKYTQSTKYICPDEQCDGHYSNQYIRMHVPGASENQTIRSDFKCPICGEILEEVKSLRTLSDQILAEVVPVHLKMSGKREAFKPKMLQAIPIFLRDELINYVDIGKTYEFIGICCKDISGDEIFITLEANFVIQIQQNYMSGPIGDCLLPTVIGNIYKNSLTSQWSFPLNMAYHFGGTIVSKAVMIKLRLFLLISLVLKPDENFLHLIAIGKEFRIIQALMTFALQFSCSFPISVTTPLYGKISNSRYPWVPYFIEGGSLFLSSDGISPVGDVGMLKKTSKENLKAAMTSGNILMDIPHKYSEVYTQPLSFPLRCHVWSYHDPFQVPIAKCGTQSCNAFSGLSTGDLSKSFLDAFSITCFVDGSSLEEDTLLLNCQQEETLGKDSHHISFDDFEQYIDLARCVRTRLTEEAENIIHHYYSMSRLARISELGVSNMPSSSLQALKSLACGLARLKLQENVVESDAVWAIFLYEEQLTSRYGISPLGIQPQPHLSAGYGQDYLISENNLLLKQFTGKLMRFCSRARDCWHEE